MDWSQVFIFIGVNVALFGALSTLIVWTVNKMDADIKSACTRLDGHAARIDQLYQVIIEMLKERK
jgi:hypothetical protein